MPLSLSKTSGVSPSCMVHTPDGLVPVDWLEAGDLIETRDNGMQPIRGLKKFSSHTGIALPGCFGVVVPGQLALIEGWPIELLFAEGEMLTPAISMSGSDECKLGTRETMISIELDEPNLIKLGDLWIASAVPDDSQLPRPLLFREEMILIDVPLCDLLVDEARGMDPSFDELPAIFGSLAATG